LFFNPTLTYAFRAAESAWPLLSRPPVAKATDLALPVAATLIGFTLLIRYLRRSAFLIGVVYIPAMITVLLCVALEVFGYGWRDYP